MCPFIFYPKVVIGDSQPWLLIAAIISFLILRFQRVHSICKIKALHILPVAFILISIVREQNEMLLYRAIYAQVIFIVLWSVIDKTNTKYFYTGFVATSFIWLAAAIYQCIIIYFQLSLEITGRYVIDRGGVPSLTPEPSLYGIISVIQIMYFLETKNRWSIYLIILNLISVLLSGSVIAQILLVFPFARSYYTKYWKFAIPIIAIYATYIWMYSQRSLLTIYNAAMNDESLNLRIGHLYFTLFWNSINSIFMLDNLKFEENYNHFVKSSDIFTKTGSDYILTSAGNLIYNYGAFGIMFLIILLREAWMSMRTKFLSLIKILFIIACFLTQLNIFDLFIIVYINCRELNLVKSSKS